MNHHNAGAATALPFNDGPIACRLKESSVTIIVDTEDAVVANTARAIRVPRASGRDTSISSR